MTKEPEIRNGYTIRDRRGQGTGVKSMSFGLFATPRSTGQEDYYRPRPYPGQNTTKLNDYEWKELVNFSRQLFAQMPNVASAIAQKNVYAVGDAWKPHYKGTNQKWGDEVEEWLYHEWYPSCDLRGGVHDFVTNLFETGLSWDVDGDDLMILTENDGSAGAGEYAREKPGYPKLKFVSSLCIGSRRNEVKGGEYDGGRVCNGIILDRDDACIGVNVLGEKVEDDVIISARDCDMRYEPEFRAFHRGVPRMSKAILEAFDLQDIHQYLKRQVKLNSAQGIIKKTVSGDADPSSDNIIEAPALTSGDTSAARPSDIKVEKMMGGEILYLQAGTGEEIQAFEHSTPHANTMAFRQELERLCMYAICWFYDLLNPASLRGACVRMIQDQARATIFSRQTHLKKRARRAVRYAVARAMQSGRIPKNYDGLDWTKWTFNLPAQLTVDSGYDQQADQQNEKIGSTTLASITEKSGRFWKDIRRQRVEEGKNKLAAAKELVEEAKEMGETLTFREALDMIGSHAAHSVAERIEEEPLNVEDR